MKSFRFAAIPSALLFLEASALAAAAAWPPVSKEELAMTVDPANPGAAAVLLSREVTTDDVKGISTEYRRIKILTDDGTQYANIEIPYVERASRVEDIQARTIRPDGTTVDFQGQIFDRTVLKARKSRIQVKAFALPEVRNGSILEYSYSIHYREKPPDVLKNSKDYIIDKTITIPSANWTVQEDLFTRRARFLIHPLPGGPVKWVLRGIPTNSHPQTQPDGSIVLVVENLPAFQEEDLMPPETMLRSQVGFYYELGPPFSITYWSDLGKALEKAYSSEIGDPKKLKTMLAGLVSPGDPPETQLRQLYKRVQQIRNLTFERSRTEQEVKREGLRENKTAEEALQRGYGSADEINLALVALARAAGFDSAPVLLASRRSKFFFPEYPDRTQLNTNVVWVRAGGKDYFLDPATPYCPFDLLPWEETATVGIAIGRVDIQPAKSNFDGLVVTPRPVSAAAVTERTANLQLDADGGVEGTVAVNFIGQEALERRLLARNQDEDARRKSLEKEMKGWISTTATVELKGAVNWDEPDRPLHADFSVKVADFAVSTGRRQLVRPAFFASTTTFQNATRIHDIYFPYPSQEADDITWKLPEGVRVGSLPEQKQQRTEFGNYAVTFEDTHGGIHVKRRFTSESIYLPKNYYAAIRAYLGLARLGDEGQAVLETTGAPDAR
jgi:Domain of Unknown Function with PDB structure (DUF3857)